MYLLSGFNTATVHYDFLYAKVIIYLLIFFAQIVYLFIAQY